MIEHELESLLRTRFKNKDQETWDLLTGESGPLGTFGQKIIAGYAFKLYDDRTKSNLTIIRLIRNAFAHSKRIIEFSESAVVDTLSEIKLPKAKKSERHRAIKYIRSLHATDPKTAYIFLCNEICFELIRRQTRGYSASSRNYRRKLNRIAKNNPFYSPGLLFPPPELLAKNALSPEANQIFDPIVAVPEPFPQSPQAKPKKPRT